MLTKRVAGVLAHPTSFPGRFGVGDLGGGAYEFLKFLDKAEQRLWQVLPLGPTSFGDSPYQGFSTFAGNPLLISPELVRDEGLLSDVDLYIAAPFDENRVDYGRAMEFKTRLFAKAYAAFKRGLETDRKLRRAYDAFCSANKFWLDDFSLFSALKRYFIEKRGPAGETDEFAAFAGAHVDTLGEDGVKDYYYGAVWNTWPDDIKNRENAALAHYEKLLSEETGYHKFLQYVFFKQWAALKDFANKLGISVIGDIPVFVAFDSADVWANSQLFQIGADGFPTSVAGVPPDYFSLTGQLWGNPLYNWAAHKRSHFSWWIRRVESALAMVDEVRIDHFRGFEAYWAVPFGDKTAADGEWKKAPGKELFEALQKKLGALPIIAEDLGIITPEVEALRLKFELPGMKVLHFAFSEPTHKYLPHNYRDCNCVAYNGTHDNDTTAGWYASAPEKERDYFRRLVNSDGADAPWDMIRLLYSSTAQYAVSTIQDIMRLGAECRTNLPGTTRGNWQFRYTAGMLQDWQAERLAYITRLFGRAAAIPKTDEKESE